ncbi:MAG: hypothetical protein KAI79_18740, partial [Bacteroidales bacterium]|nr:hypothetical protein [Bacteroidales bacterium]
MIKYLALFDNEYMNFNIQELKSNNFIKNNYLSLLLSFIYFSVSLLYLKYGFPAEDALILFRYSEILSDTGIISFNYYSEPTEGATDFLWMVLLAALHKLGINIAIGASLLNSLGVFIISYIVFNMIDKISYTKHPSNNLIIFLLLLSFLVFNKLAFASYVGFSVLAYVSLMLAVYYFAWKMHLNKWLFFSIVFILFRPEAVLLFSGSVLYILVYSLQRKINIPYKHFSILIIVGIVYFIWRYQYFNELLPLPLYVKQLGSAAYYSNLKDLTNLIYPSFMMLIVSVLFILVFKRDEFKISNIWIFSFIFLGLYLLIIITGHKSQNIENRYEAPLLIFLFLSYIAIIRNHLSNKIILCMNCLFLLVSLYHTNNFFRHQTGMDDYTKTAISIKQDGSQLKIALTEAGNIPYWTKLEIFDLAGLNSKSTAKEPLTCKMLHDFSPDLIEVDLHENTFIRRSAFLKDHNSKCGVAALSTLLKYSQFDFDTPILSYKKGGYPTTYIALINTVYCLKHSDLYS